MSRLKWTGILLLLWAIAAQATIRYVSQSGSAPYMTITAGLNASGTGDTILVGPGMYAESIQFSGRRTVIGAGWDQTTITGSVILSSSTVLGSIIEGFRIAPTNPGLNFQGTTDSVIVRRCRIQSNFNVVLLQNSSTRITVEDCLLLETGTSVIALLNSGRIVFRNCLFVHSNGNAATGREAIAGSNGNLEVYNCAFLGLRRLLNCVGAQPITVINNVIYDWVGTADYGVYLAGSVFDYNASDVISPPGTNAILLSDDPFVSYDEAANYNEAVSDLHPAVGSPIIDAGHPLILDLDGSVSDLGIYGGPRPLVAKGVPSYPFVLSLSVAPILIGVGDTVQVNSSARVGPRY